MADLIVYTTPATAAVTLTLDSGDTVTGEACSANGRDDAHRLAIPSAITTTIGAQLQVACDGYHGVAHRGMLIPAAPSVHYFLLDDVHLEAIEVPPAPVPPNPDVDPQAIIQGIFDTHYHDLSTKEGCGTFTEDCCTALHEQHSADWGHIRKEPAQNQWNGHAIDALFLRWPTPNQEAGVYDILHDSESETCTAQFIWKDAGDPKLWHYPADAE